MSVSLKVIIVVNYYYEIIWGRNVGAIHWVCLVFYDFSSFFFYVVVYVHAHSDVIGYCGCHQGCGVCISVCVFTCVARRRVWIMAAG